MRIYTPPKFNVRPSPVTSELQNSSFNPSKVNYLSSATSITNSNSFRQYISRTAAAKPIRGRELFVRSIHRIIEKIRTKKQNNIDETLFVSTLDDAIGIFHDLSFMKCMQLKKKLLDSTYRSWTIEFAREGGLHTLLTYLEKVVNKGLSLVDAILVNETLQCVRAMMNITELFEHISTNPKYIDSIARGIYSSAIY
jgi:hypothetical protein